MPLCPSETVPPPASPLRPATVLVSVPQAWTRERATQALRDVCVADFLDGLSALERAPSALLVVDLDSLDADSFGYIRQWLETRAGAQAVFLTTQQDGFRYAAAADFAAAFVIKPFLASDLRSTVQRLLEARPKWQWCGGETPPLNLE